MVYPSNLENVAIRFSPYIEELREFFKSQQIHFGQPADLAEFADRVDGSGALRDDMGSLMRSILYREAEKITPVELFEVLVLAVAGQKIEEASQEFHEPNRRLFAFINQSLRSRRKAVSEESEAEEPPGGIERRGSNNPLSRAAELSHESGNADRSYYTPTTPLFGQYGNDAHSATEQEDDDPKPRRGKAVFAYVIAAVLLAGATFYFGRSGLFRAHPGTGATEQRAANPVAATVPAPSKTVADCVGGSRSRGDYNSLSQDFRRVRDLKAQKRYDAALTGLRDIAAADPGYPGINLTISDLDLQMRRTQPARDAVSAQIAISECFANLPPDGLDTYCKEEFPLDSMDSCHSRLAQIKAAAQLQAGVVTQELTRSFEVASSAGRSSQPRTGYAVPRSLATPRPLSASREYVRSYRPAVRKPIRDQSLVEGQGTDSALGAYSKPEN